MNFPCIVCGLCCKQAGLISQLTRFVNKSGECRFLDQDTNRCQIYTIRPVICNVQIMYEIYFKDQMTETEYILQNLQVCYELNRAAGQQKNVSKILKLIEKLQYHSK